MGLQLGKGEMCSGLVVRQKTGKQITVKKYRSEVHNNRRGEVRDYKLGTTKAHNLLVKLPGLTMWYPNICAVKLFSFSTEFSLRTLENYTDL